MDKANPEARDPMPLVSSDKDGNKLRSQDEEETEITLLLKDVMFDDDFISSDGFTERVTEGPLGAATDHENEPGGREQCPIEDSNAAGLRNNNRIVSEMGDLAESSSEFDNSSDEDFQAGDEDIDSDAPSEALHDIEGSSDDDIFTSRGANKKELLQKLRMMGRMERRPVNTAQTHYLSEELNEDDWYSEPEDDEDIERAPGSDDEAPRHPQFIDGQNMKTFEMKVCLKFANVNVFRKAFKDWSVRHGYQFHYEKNERTRVTAVCAHDNCNYRIHASVVQGGPVFMVKTIKGEHTCLRPRRNKHATSKYLGERLENAVRDNPDIPVEKLKRSIMRKCGVEVSYWKALRAKKAAMEKIKGRDVMEYAQLWDYCETVRARNPESKLILRKVIDSDPPVFDRMFFSLAAMKLGFLTGCRPLIGLDGCFLKTPYGGQLLCAVGRDGNDNLFPIALAVVPIENRETWSWFVFELLDHLGGVSDKWTFISDRQKGLIEALKEQAPDCEHRYCVRHMYQNFKHKWTSLVLKDLFWKAASTCNKNEFENYMKEIEIADPKLNVQVETASEWLRNVPPCHWARSHFKTVCKSDVMVNNLCESFNNFILDARELPIISMFEWIRNRLTERIQIKKSGMEKYEGVICPNIMKKINKVNEMGRSCFQIWCGNDEFEVEHMGRGRYVVDLRKRECTCGMFQLTGYPCPHAWVSICDRRYKVENYVDSYLKKDTYLKAYEHMLHGVPGSRDYIKTPYPPMLPPNFNKKAGRPKKMRRKGAEEQQSGSFRRGLTHTCKNCLQLGHNKATCTNPRHPNSRLNKGTGAQPSVNESNLTQESQTVPQVAPQPAFYAAAQTGPVFTSQACHTDAATSSSVSQAPSTSVGCGIKQKRSRKPSIEEVLRNIRNRAVKRRN